jgi:hypothetical protein
MPMVESFEFPSALALPSHIFRRNLRGCARPVEASRLFGQSSAFRQRETRTMRRFILLGTRAFVVTADQVIAMDAQVTTT